MHTIFQEIGFEFKRASGPGGQNVNKVSTASVLKFDINNSKGLSNAVKQRLRKIAANRINADGVLIITSQRHRTQGKNKTEAISKLLALIELASIEPKSRKFIKLPLYDKNRRINAKKITSEKKINRKKIKY